MRTSLEHDTQWNLWQTGVSLFYGPILVFKIWEVPFQSAASTQPFRSSSNRFKLKLDGVWSDINLCNSSILEVYFPLIHINVLQEIDDGDRQLLAHIEPNMLVISKLLALSVDHIDLLLEDWYPSLGTRFVHTSEGRFLITRLVMCPKCLKKLSLNGKKSDGSDNGSNGESSDNTSAMVTVGYTNKYRARRPLYLQNDNGDDGALNVFSAYLNATAKRERRSEVSFLYQKSLTHLCFLLIFCRIPFVLMLILGWVRIRLVRHATPPWIAILYITYPIFQMFAIPG